MNNPVECIRCHAVMEEGFAPDNAYSGVQKQSWSPGEPKPSFWMGLKLDAKLLVPIKTLRCPRCGYLESYAVAPTVPET